MGGTQEAFEVEETTETKVPAAPMAPNPETPPSTQDEGEKKAGE